MTPTVGSAHARRPEHEEEMRQKEEGRREDKIDKSMLCWYEVESVHRWGDQKRQSLFWKGRPGRTRVCIAKRSLSRLELQSE